MCWPNTVLTQRCISYFVCTPCGHASSIGADDRCRDCQAPEERKRTSQEASAKTSQQQEHAMDCRAYCRCHLLSRLTALPLLSLSSAIKADSTTTTTSKRRQLSIVCCCCLLSVVCYLLSVVCCLLSVVRCLLSAVGCLLSLVWCLLYVVCCLLSVVCCLLSVVCCLLSVVCSLLSVVCCRSSCVICLLPVVSFM